MDESHTQPDTFNANLDKHQLFVDTHSINLHQSLLGFSSSFPFENKQDDLLYQTPYAVEELHNPG